MGAPPGPGKVLCTEASVRVPFSLDFRDVSGFLASRFPGKGVLRFVSASFDEASFDAHVLLSSGPAPEDVFGFRRREAENGERFNACFVVPTGIGCELGGHAGDANPALRLVAGQCDLVVTHPNVVNACDINEMPPNALYVEGHHLTSLLMGTAGLAPARNNRLLALIDGYPGGKKFAEQAVNSVNAAKATLGLTAKILVSDSLISMGASSLKDKATGRVEISAPLLDAIDREPRPFDAVAISSTTHVPEDVHEAYSRSNGGMINPWGGVESMLTHFISARFGRPSAHAPMLESERVASLHMGVVDPRIAPEVVSSTFLHCVLKGLQRAPKVVAPGLGISAEDISALVVPDGVLGLPVLAALRQGIPVVAVENRNTMRNDLSKLPWQEGRFFRCGNYLEACGVLACLREGVSPRAVKRPLEHARVERLPVAGRIATGATAGATTKEQPAVH